MRIYIKGLSPIVVTLTEHKDGVIEVVIASAHDKREHCSVRSFNDPTPQDIVGAIEEMGWVSEKSLNGAMRLMRKLGYV